MARGKGDKGEGRGAGGGRAAGQQARRERERAERERERARAHLRCQGRLQRLPARPGMMTSSPVRFWRDRGRILFGSGILGEVLILRLTLPRGLKE